MKEVVLTPEQVDLALTQATKLKATKDYCKLWDIEKIAMGLRGEIAYGIMIGQPINLEIWETKGDGGSDFLNGADVKTISWTGPEPELKVGRLRTNSKTKKLILAICDKALPNTIKLVGEIAYDQFKLKCKIKEYGIGNKWYAVTDKDLDLLYS